MSNSSLVNYTRISPNHSSRNGRRITKITPHHMAGNLSVERCGAVFAPTSRQASSNYGIDTDGRVGLYVNESDRAWTSSSYENDSQAVTIEVANDEIGGNWHVSDKAWNKLVELCVDICKRNGIPKLTYTGGPDGTLTTHRMFAATSCPGPYLNSRMAELANTVNARLGAGGAVTPGKPNASTSTTSGDYHVWLQADASRVWPAVKDCEEDAGDGSPIKYLSCWATPGSITAQARTVASGWLPALNNPSNITDKNTGSVGDGSTMTGLKLYYNSPNGDKAVKYRVMTSSGWLPWMIDHTDTGGSNDDFAGDGSAILRVEACIVNV